MSIAGSGLNSSPAIGRPAVHGSAGRTGGAPGRSRNQTVQVDRRKPPVMAVDNVSIRMERGENLRSARRKRQVASPRSFVSSAGC